MAITPRIVFRGSPLHRVGQIGLFVVVGLFLIRAGTSWDRPGLGLLTDGIILAIAATGLNLLTGFTGLVSIGHSAFFGLGAYTTAILVDTHGWTPGWTFFASVVICFIAGLILGLPALRLKGIYLALVTLAFATAFPALLNYEKLRDLTGGATGVKGLAYLPPDWTPFDGRGDLHKWNFWLAVGGLVLVSVIASNLIRSRFGRAMVGVRDNETAAAVMGVNRAKVKTLVFGLSASMAGFAGSLFALKLTLVEPVVQMFTLFGAIFLLVIIIVGGPAQMWGPLVGAVLFVYVRDWATEVGERNDIDGLGGLVFGVGLIIVVFIAPGGLVGLLKLLRSKVVRVVPRPPASVSEPPAPEPEPEPDDVPAATAVPTYDPPQ
jgi:branched-chain amino acid transport system permease protein